MFRQQLLYSKRKIFLSTPKTPAAPLYAGSYLQIFSRPRSGTLFLEAFIGENFYEEEDLPGVQWGHWANRKNSRDGSYLVLIGFQVSIWKKSTIH